MSKPSDIAHAAQPGADVVVLDLVEFVANKDKDRSRAAVRTAVEQVRGGGPRVFVQTSPATQADDLSAAVCPALNGIVVSRAESALQLRQTDQHLTRLETERGLAPGAIAIVVALETARGNQDAYEIVTASKRVRAITLGRADLIMDLRPEPSGEILMMPYLMQRLVIVARAAGITPLGAWWRAPDRGLLATPDNTLKAATRGRAMGFKGALCLHADQIAPLNRIYA